MSKKLDPFEIEKKRVLLARQKKYSTLKKLYSATLPEIPNENTSKLWDYLNVRDRDSLKRKNPMKEDRLASVAKLISGGDISVLNIGFGPANLEDVYFLKHKEKKVKWEGIEISSDSIKNARKKYPSAIFKKGEITRLNYNNASFDYVIASEVMEHISPSKTFLALKEINRVLKKRGHFIVSVPLNEDLEKMIQQGVNPNAHVRMYQPELIKAELRLAGFQVRRSCVLFAFNNHYRLKSIISRYLLFGKKHPNNIIILAQKK